MQLIRMGTAGWFPIPIPAGHKRPILAGWPELRLSEDQIATTFANGENVGVLLGEPSGGLVDIDLDSPETLRIASDFLPETGVVFGRESKPDSHRLYIVDPLVKTEKFEDPNGTMLVELRSTGCQTVFPPSSHSHEQVEWSTNTEPARVGGEVLRLAVGRLAAVALIARNWPEPGGRQDAAMALAGGLLASGIDGAEVTRFLQAVATAANDEENKKRVEASGFTERRLMEEKPITGWSRLEHLIGRPIVSRVCKWLGVRRDTKSLEAAKSGESSSQSAFLVKLAKDVVFFHTPTEEPFANFAVNGHRENWPVRSKAFKGLLQRSMYEAQKKPPGSQALEEALGLFEARARFDGPQQPVALRVGQFGNAIYLDLCNDKWEAVEITADGYKIISDPPVRFRRSKGIRPLPYPAAGGDLDILRGFINAQDERTWQMIVAFLVNALRPTGPYWILIIQGEAGSAKTSMARMLREIVDPATGAIRTLPREQRDFVIEAKHGWLLTYDNISGLPVWVSDCLCILATGGGLATRQLFTDDEQMIFDNQRPVILNGIDEVGARGDLVDRALVVNLAPIPDEDRKAERQLRAEFEAAKPLILGALLDVVSSAIRHLSQVKLSAHPRMADAFEWVTAAESALGWPVGTFAEAYGVGRRQDVGALLEGDPVAVAIRSFVEQDKAPWSGVATDLLLELQQITNDTIIRSHAWPHSAAALSSRLRRAAPYLRQIGIEIEFDTRESGTRRKLIEIRQVGENSVPSVPSVHQLDFGESLKSGANAPNDANAENRHLSEPFETTCINCGKQFQTTIGLAKHTVHGECQGSEQ
jgi:hypothetical protein